MLKSQNNNEVLFKWEIKVGDDTFELSDQGFNKLMEAEKSGTRLVKIGNKMINPAFISSAKKVFKNPINNFIDWSAIEQGDSKKIPEDKKIVSDEKAKENIAKINENIRKMLKEKNANWKPVYKDAVHKYAADDVWEHLKSSITALEFPTIDETWKDDKSITMHNEGRESHPVTFKTKIIDLGDKYDMHFWAEANFIFCNVCNKHIRKQIVLYNDYESECIVRKL